MACPLASTVAANEIILAILTIRTCHGMSLRVSDSFKTALLTARVAAADGGMMYARTQS